MADNKKMSVAEILAAARANKAGGAAPAATSPAAPAAAGTEAAAKAASEPSVQPTLSEATAQAAGTSNAAATAAGSSSSAKPKPGAMSTADILAAARAAKAAKAVAGDSEASATAPAVAASGPADSTATKATEPAAAKPAAAKAAAKPAVAKAEGAVAPAKPAALDTASILAAARGVGAAKPGPVSKAEAKEKGIETAPAKKKLEAPPMPAKPEYAQAKPAAKGKKEESRRGFFASVSSMIAGSSLALGFTSLAVTHLLWVLGLARYFFPNILTEPPTKFKVGFPDTLAPGQVDERFKAQFGVWVVKHEYEGQSQIFALKTVCTHLGCTPNWLEAEQKFKCPCHGSGFYKDGVNFEGPAPRPLERYAIKVSDDGQLEVDKSRVFHEETGQWKDTTSFVPT
jgi:cytochrome b6-f complex iron-sulfur subunit